MDVQVADVAILSLSSHSDAPVGSGPIGWLPTPQGDFPGSINKLHCQTRLPPWPLQGSPR